jgi:hypothetical protein
MVEEGDDRDPTRRLALSTFLPPSRLNMIAPGQELGPGIAQKVGNNDDKRALKRDGSRFEL